MSAWLIDKWLTECGEENVCGCTHSDEKHGDGRRCNLARLAGRHREHARGSDGQHSKGACIHHA